MKIVIGIDLLKSNKMGDALSEGHNFGRSSPILRVFNSFHLVQPAPSEVSTMLKAVILFACLGVALAGFDQGTFKRQIIEQHNKYRRELGKGLPDLTWDEGAAQYAQAGADSCQFSHRDQDGNKIRYGENIYMGGGPADSAGKDAVDSWYEEKRAYTYGPFEYPETKKTCNVGMKYTVTKWGFTMNQKIHSCGHYTQLIWKATTKVGCGFKDCSDVNGMKMVVCDYLPAGNMLGQTPY